MSDEYKPLKQSAESARAELDRARAEGKDADTLLREAAMSTPTQFGLPTTWGQRGGPISVDGPTAKIVAPTDHDVATYALSQVGAVCGSCKYFDLETGRAEIARQKFMERIVREEEWKTYHLGPVDAFGLCGASGGEMACNVVTEACDQYRPKRRKGRLKGT